MLDLLNIENGKLICLKKVKCFLNFPQGKYIFIAFQTPVENGWSASLHFYVHISNL